MKRKLDPQTVAARDRTMFEDWEDYRREQMAENDEYIRKSREREKEARRLH